MASSAAIVRRFAPPVLGDYRARRFASATTTPRSGLRLGFMMSAVCPVYPKQQTSPDTVGRFWATNGRCREANRWHATAECAPKMPQRAEGGGNLPSAASSRSVDGGDTGFRRCRHPGEAYSLTWTADPQPSRTTNLIVDALTLVPSVRIFHRKFWPYCALGWVEAGRARIAMMLTRVAAVTYQAGEMGSPVAPMSQVTTNCVVPPNSEVPAA